MSENDTLSYIISIFDDDDQGDDVNEFRVTFFTSKNESFVCRIRGRDDTDIAQTAVFSGVFRIKYVPLSK